MSTTLSPLMPALSATSTTQTGNAAAPASTDPLASESTFLTLLVSQLQNQDPLDPVDSNQFVSQLTEYSQLEQLIGIHTDTSAISQAATAGTSAGTATQAATQEAGQTGAEPAPTTSSTSQTTSTTGAN